MRFAKEKTDKGVLTIEVNGDEVNAKFEGSFAACVKATVATIDNLYVAMKQSIKEDVSNPEEVIEEKIYEVVDMGIAQAKLRELERLSSRLNNNDNVTSSEIIDGLLLAMEFVKKRNGGVEL